MSLSSVIGQQYLAEIDVLSRLLESFLLRRRSAPTKVDQVLIEAEAVQLFERLLDFNYKLEELKPGDYPEFNEISGVYSDLNWVLQSNLSKLRRLVQLFIRHFNTQQYMLADLYGRMKRVRQKRAALALWSGDDAKFVLSEKFLTLDWLGNQFVSEDSCFVDTQQGALTLPVRDYRTLPISGVKVGAGSNGVPGNSDVDVTTNNGNPDFTINGDSNNWFEYERLDSGPLELSLVVELTKADIVNNIVIAPVNDGLSYSFVVEDIVFDSYKLSDLAGPSDPERMTVKSAGNDSEWSISFLPVVTRTITIKIKQTQSHTIVVANRNLGTTERRRWSIGVSRIGIGQYKYESIGAINSLERQVPPGMYLAIPFVEVWPPKPDLFDALVEISFDSGESWVPAENVDDGIGQSVLMDGSASQLLWRMRMERDDEALDSVTSFLPDITPVKKVGMQQRNVSRDKSPTRITLPERPVRSEVVALQPRVARRGFGNAKVFLGSGTGIRTNYQLPFSPLTNGVDPDAVHIYVNDVEIEYVEDNSSIGVDQWSFSDDFTKIQTPSTLADGGRVSMRFDPELMLFEERSDGYYHKMEFLFDPDEYNIDILRIPRAPARNQVVIPRDKRIVSLGFKNINASTFELVSGNGTSYASAATRAAMLSTPGSYHLNSSDGILWLNTYLGADHAVASFDQQSGTQLSNDDFDVVFNDEGVLPWGVRIAPSAFQAQQVTDTIGSTLEERLEAITGLYQARGSTIGSNPRAEQLGSDYIVKGTLSVDSGLFDNTYNGVLPEEVAFVDGVTEFLGLIPMNSDTTVETVADATGIISFNLAAGSRYYSTWPVLFSNTSVFQNRVSTPASAGEYSLNSSGEIAVFVGSGATLPGGIQMRYHYSNPDFDPDNKYSVDYRNGVLYGGADLVTGATIKYRCAKYICSYNIAQEIDDYSYDARTNSVSVRTEGLGLVNKLVKLVWAKSSGEDSLRAMRDYFSPIVSTFAIRFN